MKVNYKSDQMVRDITRKMKKDGTKIRETAALISTSPSTLCRVLHYKLPDIQTYFKLCVWLNKPMKTYLDVEW